MDGSNGDAMEVSEGTDDAAVEERGPGCGDGLATEAVMETESPSGAGFRGEQPADKGADIRPGKRASGESDDGGGDGSVAASRAQGAGTHPQAQAGAVAERPARGGLRLRVGDEDDPLLHDGRQLALEELSRLEGRP